MARGADRGRGEARAELGFALGRCRRAWAGVAMFSACTNVLMLAVPVYMMQIYDRVLATRSVDTLIVLSAMVLAALVVFGTLDALRVRVAERVGRWLDATLGATVLAGAVADALRAGGGVSAQGLRDLATVRGYVSSPAVMALFDAPWAPVFLGVIFLIHPVLGWIGLAGALVLCALAVANDLATRAKTVESATASAHALNAADAAVRNADAIVAMGMLPALARRFAATTERSAALGRGAADASGAIAATAKAVRFALQVAMLGVGAYLVLGHEMTPGAMIAAAIILARGLAPAEQLIGSWRTFTGARAAYRRLAGVVELAPAAGARTALPRPAGRLELEEVTYIAPGRREPVLRAVQFALSPGEVLAVIGPSGAGKSTLARLIVGSLAPSVGHVRLDGAPMHTWDEASRGRFVGYLPQDVELFAGTVRENIARFGASSDADVVAAARAAGAHETIVRLPEGYDTPIGAGGVPISGGQHQRIGLARALLGAPALLVLDEPNAHLDGEGEQALAQAVRASAARGTTVVLVTQRLGAMACADKMAVVRDAAVVAFGPREAILASMRRAEMAHAPAGLAAVRSDRHSAGGEGAQ